jgi:hypothetical protein
MNKRILLLAIFMIGISSLAHSQHNLKPNSICKFVKGPKNMEGMSACNACTDERKKNEAAMKKEYEKRMAANKVEEAQKLKKIEQDYAKRSEAKRKAVEEKGKNVVTFAPPKTETKVPAPTTTLTNTKAGYLYTYYRLFDLQLRNNYGSHYGYVLNAKGDTILKRNELFYEFYGSPTLKYNNPPPSDTTFPKNVVVTKLTKNAKCKKYPERDCLPVWDMLNAKGERHFNDNTVVGIIHITGNFFLVVYAPSDGSSFEFIAYEKAAIYNISDRSFFWLEDKVTYRDGSYLSVSKDVSKCPKLLFNEKKDIQSWDENMAANNIKDYVVLKTGSHYPEKYAVYYFNSSGKIAKKIFLYDNRMTSEIQ